MKEYELLYIVPTQFTDEEVTEVQASVTKLLEDVGAKILRNENQGKIRLAYPIKKIRHGSYVLVHFNAEGSVISAFDRKMRLTDEVLRHTIVERAEGALEKTFELSSYIAPLSEEAKRDERPVRKRTTAPSIPTPTPAVAPPAPASASEPSMSMEELDKKLDKILKGDIAENI